MTNTQYKIALAAYLHERGFTSEDLAWADENPYIRQAQHAFHAGWLARDQWGEQPE